MKIASIILLSVLCVGMGVIYTIFYKRDSWQGIVIKGLTMLSILALALISTSLREISNAMPIFITLALALLIMSETIKGSQTVDENAKLIVFSLFSFASTTLFAISAITLSQFNVLALIGGILTGVGLGLIVCAVKKTWSLWPMVMEILVWLSIGLLLGFTLTATMIGKHLVSSVLMLVGAVLILSQKMLNKFRKDNKIFDYLENGIYVLALVLMTISIYFY